MGLLSTPARRWYGRRAWVIAVLLIATTASSVRGDTIRVGDRFPALRLTDWQGVTVPLDTGGGRVTVVDFWASWCHVCRAALPAIDSWARSHSMGPLVVIAINIDRDRTAADGFLAQYLSRPAVQLLRDPGGNAFARLGAEGMPALYVIDRAGVVRLVEAGYVPERLPEIERVVEDLLAVPVNGQTPAPAQAPE